MSTAVSRRAKTLLLAAVALSAASSIVTLLQLVSFEIAELVANGTFVAVGALIVLRRPGNLLGPLLVTLGTGWIAVIAAIVTAESLDEAGRVDAASWVSLVASVATIPLLWLAAAMWLVFPDGRTKSARTQRLLRCSAVYALIVTVAGVFASPQVLPETKRFPHPFLNASHADLVSDILLLPTVVFFLFGYVVAGMLIARIRHSGPIERRQIGWVAVAIVAGITLTVGNVIVQPLGTENRAFFVLDAAATLFVALAMGVAILKYRLYEIDRIISRSVTFGVLAVFIAGVYVAIVVGVGSLLGANAPFGLQVVASVLIAMAFQPVRGRVQRWANRLVYGERATPYEVLVRFSRRSAELSDEELLLRIPRLIVDGTGAENVSLWTRSDDGFRTAASWPADTVTRRLLGDGEFADPEADYSLPVFHDDELLGGLSLVKVGGETVTPAEEALLDDLASGMGLALRNARLTGQLRRQVAELEASRERVLAAADAARRALENDLDSGPQQALVAVKVKLGPTRKRAELAGAEKLAGFLAQLEADAGEAIRAVRDFAGGIYPPLLEAEGLVTAIGQQAQKSAVPVSMRGGNVGRYPPEVEAAVYFSVLEALQNTAKYAEASSVSVTLAESNGSLTFEVRDNGCGFDSAVTADGAGLTGMADRLDIVGGQVNIESKPAHGTTVVGSVPIAELISA
jgi:signal transduction histidine kinase